MQMDRTTDQEFLSQNKIDFTDRNIATDETTLAELDRVGYMTTPVTMIDGEIVVGFDVPKLRTLLRLQSGGSPKARCETRATLATANRISCDNAALSGE
jgi:glutaredoxin